MLLCPQNTKDLPMQSKVICIANQKGGVGKTTTAVNLGASLALNNKKTLLIDIDPQGNAGSGLGIRVKEGLSIYNPLVLDTDIQETVQKTELSNLDFIGSNINLTGAEIELVNLPQREFRLRRGIERIRTRFEYIIVDCPPSLGLLTINSLVAADSVLIPLQCEYYALEGLSQLINTIKLIKVRLNPHLVIEGILLTMFDTRNRLSRQVADEIMQHFGTKVFKVLIPRNVRLAECPSHGKPAFLYDSQSVGSQSYMQLAQQIANNERDANV